MAQATGGRRRSRAMRCGFGTAAGQLSSGSGSKPDSTAECRRSQDSGGDTVMLSGLAALFAAAAMQPGEGEEVGGLGG